MHDIVYENRLKFVNYENDLINIEDWEYFTIRKGVYTIIIIIIDPILYLPAFLKIAIG